MRGDGADAPQATALRGSSHSPPPRARDPDAGRSGAKGVQRAALEQEGSVRPGAERTGQRGPPLPSGRQAVALLAVTPAKQWALAAKTSSAATRADGSLPRLRAPN
jgi:hypothetical protein